MYYATLCVSHMKLSLTVLRYGSMETLQSKNLRHMQLS